MTKFTKWQAKTRGALGKGVFGATGSMNKVAALTQSILREIHGGDNNMVAGLANTVADARTALTSMSMGSG